LAFIRAHLYLRRRFHLTFASRWCGRRPQPGDQRQDFLKHLSRHRDLGHLLVWTAPDGIKLARMRSL
jgi:hypothetical protein